MNSIRDCFPLWDLSDGGFVAPDHGLPKSRTFVDHFPSDLEAEGPSGETIQNDIEQTFSQYPNTRSRNRREAMTEREIQSHILSEDEKSDVGETDEAFNTAEESDEEFVNNYSWFNPHAPNAYFRINFAAKIGVSPDLMFAVFAAVQDGVAISYEDAMKSKQKDLYVAAMNAEYEGMLAQNVFELKDLPTNRKSVKGKWVFRKKFDMFGKLIKIKARWVAKGFTQVQGQDYFETFAAVAKLKSVRVFLATATSLKLDVYQHDVPQAFLGTGLNGSNSRF